jgi:hypothetical protein
MRRITALPGSMRRRRPRGAYSTNTPPLPPFSFLRNLMFITGSLFLIFYTPTDNGLPCCNNELVFLPLKIAELAFILILTKIQSMCWVNALFTTGFGSSWRVLTKVQRACSFLSVFTCGAWGSGRAMSSRCLWNRRHGGRRPHISAKEGGYVGHETNIGCPRPKKQKTMLLNQPAASPHKQAVPLAPLTKNMSSICRIL